MEANCRSAAVSAAAIGDSRTFALTRNVTAVELAHAAADTAALRRFWVVRLAPFQRKFQCFVMSTTPPRANPGPPRNPWLRDLVAGKREWASSLKTEDAKLGFRGWHERGFLPHRDEPGLTQFVTFRLADGFPAELQSEWQHLFQIEDDRQRRIQLEEYLDQGRGACALKEPAVARMVQDALQFFDQKRYELKAWVVMPNHVHVLFKITSVPMSKVLESWKKYTAHQANAILGKSGKFWQEEYWDTFIRDQQHEQTSKRYIETNPTNAKIVLDPGDYQWSSASPKRPTAK
jgi:REP-associated tyrosine transposase